MEAVSSCFLRMVHIQKLIYVLISLLYEFIYLFVENLCWGVRESLFKKNRIMCTKGICVWLLIITLNRHFNQYLINIQIDTWSTLNRHLINSWSTDSWVLIDRLTCIGQKLVDGQPTVDWDVDGVMIVCQPKCRWSVDRVSMDCWSRVVGGYR